ncbi:glycosyltransferase family 39 protein [Saccharicrinis sp. GN24d3]|uniref:glycosyltransferase family 39 protein n=1 Tax=Saccharicrinis sp. GN24d3 TaxID=3458416 RepID=UPI00403512CE
MAQKNTILGCLIILKFAIQILAIDSGYELHRDEYLHLDLGKHLAWGYTSVPPVTAWISFLIIQFGNSAFSVKFFPALFGVLTMVVVWKIVEQLKGGIYALILASVSVIFSVLVRVNTLYQPNSLEFLLWTLIFYFVIKYINTESNKWIWIAAVTFAVGFLNKYNIVFLLLGLLPAILLTNHRKVFANKQLYFSFIAGLILVSPNLIWQYENGFPVIRHLNTLAETQLVNVRRLDFIIEQLKFFMGSWFVIILALAAFFTYKPFRKFKLFFWSYFFTLFLYVFFKAKGYYAIGLYPVLLAFGSVYAEQLFSKGRLRYLRFPLIMIPVLSFLALFQIVLPVLSPEQIVEKKELFQKIGLLRWEDGKDHDLPQDFADMLGWKELANMVDSALMQIPDKENTLIHCDNYGQAGAINYYSKQICTDAVSMNADYIYWYPLEEMVINNVILVKDSRDTDTQREFERPYFKEVTLVGEITNTYAREKGTTVYLLKEATQSINKIMEEIIHSRMQNPNLN